jgi:hypothetical protein
MNALRSVALAAVLLSVIGCKKAEDDASDGGRGGASGQGGGSGSGGGGSGGSGTLGDGGRAFNGGACPMENPAGMTCDLDEDTCNTNGQGGKLVCVCGLDSFGLLLWSCGPDVDAGEEGDQ